MNRTANRTLGWALLILGAALGVTALLGPLGTGAIRYRVTSLMLSQLKGADTVSLFLVAPGCILVGALALRRHPWAPALAMGPAVYTMYMFAENIVGPDYLRLPGNNERYFPLMLGVFVLAGAVLVGAWHLLDPSGLPSGSRRQGHLVGGLLVGLGGFLVLGRYLPGLAQVMGTHPTSADYLASPTIYWTIALEDLGVVIPVMLVVGVGLWRGRTWATRASFAVVGWAALVPVAVAAMAVWMLIDKQPSASLPAIGLMSAMAIAFLLPGVVTLLPLLKRHRPGRPLPNDNALASHSAASL